MNKQLASFLSSYLVLVLFLQTFSQCLSLQNSSSVGGFTQMVIGLNSFQPDAFVDTLVMIDRFGGRLVDSVTAATAKIAVVAEFPVSTVQAFSVAVATGKSVRYVEPNCRLHVQFAPNDPYWLYQWGPQKIQTNVAWDTTIGNPNLLVAIVDTGIAYTHPDLAPNFVPLGYNWVSNNTDTLDDNGHGTHVAGIIAAVINNSIGIAGIANVSIMAEKSFDATGSANETDAAKGIIHAVDQGARIISNSWGGDQDSSLIHDAVRYAYNHEVLVLAAAGNDASDAPIYPAAYPEVMGVTATDVTDSLADFSSFGDWVEIAAPGLNIYSTLPPYAATLTSPPYVGYGYMSGTSMACPHAAGVAALIWSQFPNASRDWVRAKLRYSVADLGSLGFDPLYGYGRVSASGAVEPPPTNDVLAFSLQQPDHVQAATNITSQITVMNFGTNDQNNITIELLANGTLVTSSLIPFLEGESTISLDASWTPIIGGEYNVTAYVVPVPGENFTANNVVSRMLSVLQVILNPAQGPVGTKVGASGLGFSPGSIVTMSFNDVFMGNMTADDQGEFLFVFNVPMSSAEQQTVKATGAGSELTSANFTTLDTSALSVQVDSGSLHFVGEIVEFYVQTSFDGRLVNATLTNSLLYKPDGNTVALTSLPVDVGLYKLVQTISENLTGTYALVLTANYEEETVNASGTAFKSFLVSNTLAGVDSEIRQIKDGIATLQTEVGVIQLNLTELNTTLSSIFVRVTEISGSIATLDTTLGAMQGTVMSMQTDIATIKTDIGTLDVNVSALVQNQRAQPWEQLAAIVIALIAAAIAALALVYARQKRD